MSKKIFSRAVSVLLVLIIIGSVILSVPMKVSADSLYVRKIVSLVYDDSGSMDGNSKIHYANYATQAFCALLNSEDRLFITYMNNSSASGEVMLSDDKINNSVQTIKNDHSVANGGTPYAAVTNAFNTLKSAEDSNENTQYWLVVITDGDFSGVPKEGLDKTFEGYFNTKMPNGTCPNICYFAIGNDAIMPNLKNINIDPSREKDFTVEKASTATEIVGVMSEIADRVSGRSRLDINDINLSSDKKTIEISSEVPLINIAMLSQGTTSSIKSVKHSNGSDLNVSRNLPISSKIGNGCAVLIDNQDDNIPAGKYLITFENEVKLEDFDIMFEPAVEVRLTIKVNGKVIDDISELQKAEEGHVIDITYGIYEMGTDNEIKPNLLPKGTKFNMSISEDSKVVASSDGESMKLSSYELKRVLTNINTSISIPGFNPIERVFEFTPAEHTIIYTAKAEFVDSKITSIKHTELSSNKKLQVAFTFFADGQAIKDPEQVKALNPQISVSPEGDAGDISYDSNGRLIFTPNKASTDDAANGYYDVEVKCSYQNNDKTENVSLLYTVMTAEYAIIPNTSSTTIMKHAFYGNNNGVSFYITKDGVKLDKKAVEATRFSAELNEAYSDMKVRITVQDDGTILCVPYCEVDESREFWLFNFIHYWFELENDDVELTFIHQFGSADSTIDVISADTKYQIIWVFAPLALIIFVLLVIAYVVYRYINTITFSPNAVLFFGNIVYDGRGGHRVDINSRIRLSEFNTPWRIIFPKKGAVTIKDPRVGVISADAAGIRCGGAPSSICREMVIPSARDRDGEVLSPNDVYFRCINGNMPSLCEVKYIEGDTSYGSDLVYSTDNIYLYKVEIAQKLDLRIKQPVNKYVSADFFCYQVVDG